jgi:putative ATPase
VDLLTLVERALADPERGLGRREIGVEEGALDRLVKLAGGDARVALTALEMAVEAGGSGPGAAPLTVAAVEDAMQRPALLYDKAGDMHFHLISAFNKSIRGSDPDASVYWLARMLEAGEDPLFVARRLVILAAEDVGLADPMALVVASACQQAVHFVGMPEGFLPLSECTLYLASAPKSNSALVAFGRARQDVAESLNEPVPLHLRNAVTAMNRSFGFGEGYRYAHDFADHYVEQEYLPANLVGKRYYEPTEQGAEREIKVRLARLRENAP